MDVVINGQKQQLPEEISLQQLLERLKLQPVRIAVERNRQIVPRRAYASTQLAGGDQIEIVTFVGGG